jgi:hypothetical protein
MPSQPTMAQQSTMPAGPSATASSATSTSSSSSQSATAAAPPPQATSDENLREVRADLVGFIADLQNLQSTYGGHRDAAIGRFQAAVADLGQALAFKGAQLGTQPVDDWTVLSIEHISQRLVALLNADDTDYGGHRVDAVSAIQAAIGELGAALQP